MIQAKTITKKQMKEWEKKRKIDMRKKNTSKTKGHKNDPSVSTGHYIVKGTLARFLAIAKNLGKNEYILLRLKNVKNNGHIMLYKRATWKETLAAELLGSIGQIEQEIKLFRIQEREKEIIAANSAIKNIEECEIWEIKPKGIIRKTYKERFLEKTIDIFD